MMFRILLVVVLFNCPLISIGQNKPSNKIPKNRAGDAGSEYLDRTKFPTYFGLQFRTLVPSSIGGSASFSNADQNFTLDFSSLVGGSYGVTIRKGITKLIAFETGINYVKRTYQLKSAYADSSYNWSTSLSFISYEIPLNALVYIQMGKKTFANVSMGTFLNYSPSFVHKELVITGLNKFNHFGITRSKANFCFNTSVGVEYRTEKSGFFYFGGSAVVPIIPIFDLYSEYNYGTNTIRQFKSPIAGSYLSIDVKYIFQNIKNKGTQFNKGPGE